MIARLGSGKPVLCVALAVERLAVRPAAASMHVLTVGMGAHRPCVSLLASGDGALVVAGVAGALVDGVRPGDLVVADSLLPPEVPGPGLGDVAVGDTPRPEVPGPGLRQVVTHSLPRKARGVAAPDRLAPIPVPEAASLAAALRQAGLTVHVGSIAAARAVVSGAARGGLARGGAIAVDMESYRLAALAPGRRLAVVRAVVDTPHAPLLRPGTAARGAAALRSLRRAAGVLETWARSSSSGGTAHASPLAQEVV